MKKCEIAAESVKWKRIGRVRGDAECVFLGCVFWGVYFFVC